MLFARKNGQRRIRKVTTVANRIRAKVGHRKKVRPYTQEARWWTLHGNGQRTNNMSQGASDDPHNRLSPQGAVIRIELTVQGIVRFSILIKSVNLTLCYIHILTLRLLVSANIFKGVPP